MNDSVRHHTHSFVGTSPAFRPCHPISDFPFQQSLRLPAVSRWGPEVRVCTIVLMPPTVLPLAWPITKSEWNWSHESQAKSNSLWKTDICLLIISALVSFRNYRSSHSSICFWKSNREPPAPLKEKRVIISNFRFILLKATLDWPLAIYARPSDAVILRAVPVVDTITTILHFGETEVEGSWVTYIPEYLKESVKGEPDFKQTWYRLTRITHSLNHDCL